MKQASQVKLLSLLEDGEFHSSEELVQQLNISLPTLQKEIDYLQNLKLGINYHPQKGYQLSLPMKFLNLITIKDLLSQRQFFLPVSYYYFTVIDSTNRFLKELISTAPVHVCCAETQTQGRGRLGRKWSSPFGENIYFSMRWRWNGSLSQLSGLSLVISLAILACLQPYNSYNEIQLKWPNDLIWRGKKLSGVLIELNTETNNEIQIIIGIGININSTASQKLSDKPWCSLYEIAGLYLDRNQIIADLIYYLHDYLNQFKQNSFSYFHSRWQKVDYLRDKYITISQPLHCIQGYARGVNLLGQLIIEGKNKELNYISSGEATVANSHHEC